MSYSYSCPSCRPYASQFDVDKPHSYRHCHRDEKEQPHFLERRPGIAGAAPAFPSRNVRLPNHRGNPRPNQGNPVFWRRLHLPLSALPGSGKTGEQSTAGGRWPKPQLLQTHPSRRKASRRIDHGVEARYNRHLVIDGGAICLKQIISNNCDVGSWIWIVPSRACGGWFKKSPTTARI